MLKQCRGDKCKGKRSGFYRGGFALLQNDSEAKAATPQPKTYFAVNIA